jgi:hypothetical protein
MPHSDEIVRQRQTIIREQMDDRGLALKVVAFKSGIPYPTLLSYFPQPGAAKPVMLPASAVYALAGALPLDLLSLLVPGGFLIVRVPEAVDHDQVEEACRDFLREKGASHHPESECGREIGPGEDKALSGKVAHLRAVA